MRLILVVLVVVAGWAIAAADPKPAPAPRSPTPTEQAELERLQKESIALIIKQDHRAAIPIARKIYALKRKIYGDKASETYWAYKDVAQTLDNAGDRAEASKMYEELVKRAELEHGKDSEQVLWALKELSGTYMRMPSRRKDLEALNQRVMVLTKKLYGEDSKQYRGEQVQEAVKLESRDQYIAAQRTWEDNLRRAEANAKSKTDPGLADPIARLARSYWQTNRRNEAIALFNRVIAITEADPQTTPDHFAGTLVEIAADYQYGNRDDLAAPLLKRAIELYERHIVALEKANPNDPRIGPFYSVVGMTYRRANDAPKAERAFTRALELANKAGNGTTFGMGMMLADIKRAQGKPKEALALLEQEFKARPVDETAPYMIDVLRELREFKRGEAMMSTYLGKTAKRYGKRHPVYASGQLQLSYLHMSGGNIGKAELALREALDSSERALERVLNAGTETDHNVYFAKNGYWLDTAISFQHLFAPNHAAATRLGLTTLLRRKGRVLDAAAASQATLRAKLSADDRKLLDELAAERTKLAKLIVAGPSATKGDYAKEVAALDERIQQLEVQVGKKSTAYRVVTAPVTLTAVQNLIPKDARLVELVNYQPMDPRAPYSLRPVEPPRRFAAYVLGRTGDPAFVDLGPAPAIEQAVEKFRAALSNPDNEAVVQLGRKLYDLTFAKLRSALGSSTNVLMAPDGVLNVIPFAALVDTNNEVLIKRFTFTYLTSGRDLLRLQAKTKAQGGGVIFADPKFESTTTKPAPGTRGVRSVELGQRTWEPLPGTGQEADAVAKTMRGLTLYRGEQATESQLKTVRGPKILHLATHGFFLEDERRMVDPNAIDEQHTPVFENPLLRSGLVLAGANKLSSGADDGIVTAMEASGLDLSGTQLVVLSACETGVGKVTNGDGVYGLRRALVIAGAESLVMSLWQVDDTATQRLMTGYYTKLGKGQSRGSALREVQLELQRTPKYAHPFYWASFVPTGSDAPL
jgi:CHAT domain-containing protein/tetratricopeptide (TPR) repeat protein